MEIKGTIIQALPEVSGISKSGNAWKKREYILENNEGSFPRKIHFTCFGDNADKIVLSVGQNVVVQVDIESREFNGRWYTDLRAWRADIDQTVSAPAAPQPIAPQAPAGFQGGVAVPPPPAVANSAEDEFPF